MYSPDNGSSIGAGDAGSEPGMGDTSAASFLYEDPLAPQHHHHQQPQQQQKATHEQLKKKKKRKKGDNVVDETSIGGGGGGGTLSSQAASQTGEHGSGSHGESGEEQMSATQSTASGKQRALFLRESIRRMGENLTKKQNETKQEEGEEEKEEEQEIEPQTKSAGGKFKLPLLGKIFPKKKKGGNGDVEMGDVASTAVSSGYLSPKARSTHLEPVGNIEPQNYGESSRADEMIQPTRTVQSHAPLALKAIPEEEIIDEKEILMKEKEKKISHAKICESVAVTVVLLAGFILGIILTAMSSLGVAFQILGPTILGLTAFGLVGKVFVTIFWQEDPYRWAVSHIQQLVTRLGPKTRSTQQQQQQQQQLINTDEIEMAEHYQHPSNVNYPHQPPLPPPPQAMESSFDLPIAAGGQQTPSFMSLNFTQQDVNTDTY